MVCLKMAVQVLVHHNNDLPVISYWCIHLKFCLLVRLLSVDYYHYSRNACQCSMYSFLFG